VLFASIHADRQASDFYFALKQVKRFESGWPQAGGRDSARLLAGGPKEDFLQLAAGIWFPDGYFETKLEFPAPAIGTDPFHRLFALLERGQVPQLVRHSTGFLQTGQACFGSSI